MIVLIFIELYVLALASLVFALVKLVRAKRKFLFTRPSQNTQLEPLPAVSVCIPARNETHAMTECLEAVLASTYPKLEVIVLDDHSSDNTSHLIRAFAHAGVRFVQGDPLPEDWLGKNYSLQALADEASGTLILFMDVDTRFQPQTIGLLVEKMQAEKAKMVSIIPQRYDTTRMSAWFSTMRYFWELVLDSRSIPGVSSAAWLIDRHILVEELRGFHEWRDEVQPESHIAAEMVKTDEYRLFVSTSELGIHYEKKWSSQMETSRRLLLPRFGNSITSVLLGAGLSCSVVLAQVILLLALLEQSWAMVGAQVLLGCVALLVFWRYYRLVFRDRAYVGLVVASYIAWQELYLLLSSAIGYKRGTITWKGRPVSRPMRKRTLL